MDIEKYWNKAIKHTEVIRSRIQILSSSSDSTVPYILLSPSEVDSNDTIVRKGSLRVQKPSLLVPPNNPQFDGFEFDGNFSVDQNSLVNFLLVRGIQLPSLNYNNQSNTLDVFAGKMSVAIKHYKTLLEEKENITTGLITAPQDCWQFSLLVFICAQINKNVSNDLNFLFKNLNQRRDGEF